MAGSSGGNFTRVDLERLGFSGFVSVRELRRERPVAASVPRADIGVYVAYRESERPVSFVRVSPAGRWRGDPTRPLPVLRARWVPESPIVYIGRADRRNLESENSLRDRVKAYIRFGAGSNARHSGGYPTWQLADSDRLLIAWCVTRAPRALERRLVVAHQARFGALPFANSVVPDA